MAGWILIHRQLKENWIWNDATKLKWWLDILLTVNHANAKVLLKGTVIECKRGQCVKSLETWAKEWHTTRKTVSVFFTLLSNQGMLLVENVKISTRITVCKYDSYNGLVNGTYPAEETLSKRNLPTNNKELNNDKEKDIDKYAAKEKLIKKKKEDFTEKVRPFIESFGKDLCNDFWFYWTEPHADKPQLRWESEKHFEIQARLRTFRNNKERKHK